MVSEAMYNVIIVTSYLAGEFAEHVALLRDERKALGVEKRRFAFVHVVAHPLDVLATEALPVARWLKLVTTLYFNYQLVILLSRQTLNADKLRVYRPDFT